MRLKTISFIPNQTGSLYVQLYESIKQDILQGHMKKDDQLPSIRACAKQCNLSTTTVENAYQRLWMEGYIKAIAQKGYFIDVDEQQVDLRREIIEVQPKEQVNVDAIDLRSSSIDAQAFDPSIWLHYLKDVLREDTGIMSYGDSQGELSLRIALQKYAYAMRGVLAREEQIVVGASFQSLLYLICSLYDKRKVVAMEIGGFPQAEQVFHDCGFEIIYLHHDEEGILLEELKRYEIGLLYMNSASCGSKKQALRSRRRSALLAYAKEQQILILEDDHNGELRYQTKMRPAMQGFDLGKQVIYIRSFSKLLLPSIRMSFMVLNEELSKQYSKVKGNYNPSASKIEQLALARYLMDGHMEKQIRHLRRRYEAKSTSMIKAIQTELPDWEIILDESALQVLLKPPTKLELDALVESGKRHHIYIQKHPLQYIALSFAANSQEEFPDIIHKLHKAWITDHILSEALCIRKRRHPLENL